MHTSQNTVSHIATHLHEWDFLTVIHDFYVRITASDSTIKCRDGGKPRLFSRLSLNIKIADKGKEMNLHQSEGLTDSYHLISFTFCNIFNGTNILSCIY